MCIGKWRTDESYLVDIMLQNHPNNKDPLVVVLATSKTIGYWKLRIFLNFLS
jgi:hypothetical protein